MTQGIRILIVEDREADVTLAQREIRKSFKNCKFRHVSTQKEYLAALESFQPDVILSDYDTPNLNGMKALKLAKRNVPSTPFIIWTDSLSEDASVACLKAGANNYVLKDNVKRLSPAILQALAERQLILDRKEAEERYQAIFENSPEGIFQSTPGGRFINVNPAMARIYGYDSPQDMIEAITNIGKQIYINHRDRSEFIRLFESDGAVVNFEMKNRRKDGSVFWTSTSARVVRDNQGDILYYEGFLQDITERKQAEEKLREQENRFRALIENSLDNISLLAEDGTLLWENPATTRTLGYTQDEFVKRNIFELMHPDDLEWTSYLFADLTHRPGEQERGLFRLKHQVGSWRWIECTATNMLHDPGVRAIVINYRDVTARKQAEIEIEQRNDDLRLINAINEAVLRGDNLGDIVNLIGQEIKRIFSSEGCTTYMLDADEKSLIMQQYFLPPALSRRIEQLIGSTIPLVQIPIAEDSHFRKVMESGRGMITSDPEEIQKWITEFTETPFLPPVTRGAIRKLVPQIYKLLNIKSMIMIPLVSEGKVLGMLDASSSSMFTTDDLERMENISRQLTAAIQHQQTNEKVRQSEKFLQSIQNALSAGIVILDEEGTIVQVNSTWRKFVEQYGLEYPEYGLGSNYLEICDSTGGPYGKEASAVTKAIREVITETRKGAQIEYPYQYLEETRWYILRITKFESGNQIWVVLAHENITERKQAEAAEHEQRTLAEALRDAAEILNSTLEYGEVLDHILTTVGRVVLHDSATIMLIEDGNAKVARSQGYEKRGFHAEVMEAELPLPETTNLRQMLETRQPVVISDTQAYPGWKELPSAQWLRSNLGAPISIHGKVIGFILLDSETPGFFTQEHGKRLEAFATQAALAIHNARLLQRAQAEIAERKEAENALRNSEMRFAGIVNSAMDAIISVDAEQRIVLFNPAAEKIFGCKSEEAIGQSLERFIPQRYRVSHKEQVANFAQTGDTNRFMGHLGTLGGLRSDGTEFPIEASISHIEAGRQHLHTIILRDITERKQAEEALRESEERYRQLLNVAPIGVAVHADGKIVFANPTGARIVGADSPKDLIGKPIMEFIHPDARDDTLKIIQRMIKGEQGLYPREERFMKTDGDIVPVEVIAVPLSYMGRNAVQVIVQDITERKQAENELRLAKEKYLNIFEHSLQGIFQSTLAGQYITVNPALARMWKYDSPEDLITNITDIANQVYVNPEVRAKHIRLLAEQGDNLTGFEYQAYCKDGSIIWVLENVRTVRDETGKVLYFEGTVDDISIRKQAEEALLQNEQRLRIAIAGANIAVFNQDKDLRYTWMYQPQLGYTSRQVTGKTDAELLPAQDAEFVTSIKRHVLETGKPARAEVAIHSAEQASYFNLIVEPLLDDQNATIGITGSTLDITDRIKNELEIRRHLAEMEALYENGLAVGKLLEPKQIGDRIIETFARYLSWHHVTIRLKHPDSDILKLIAFNQPGLREEERTDVERLFNSMINQVGQGLSGWAIATGRAFRTGNVHAHSQYMDTHPGIQSGLYMPLKIGERITGVISVESEEANAFTAQDERLLATLANQAAVAFENARLYQSAQQEITERKRVEKELRESRERYQLLVETSPDGIGMMDMNGSIGFCNHQMADLFKFNDPAELIGTNIISLIALEEQSHLMQYMGTAMPNGISQEDFWLVRKDGTRFFGEVRSSALRNEIGEPYAIIGQVRDVTERKQSQEALQEERQRFLDLFENSPIATWLEDFTGVIAWMNELKMQGVEDLRKYLEKNPDEQKTGVRLIRILDVNQAAVSTNGAHSKDELIKKVHELMTDETPSQVMIDEMERIWEGQTSFGFEMSSHTLDGSIITGIQRIYIPVNNGQADYGRVIVTSTDISERVKVEKELRASEVHYRELANSITDILFELDEDLHYFHWNKASESLTGLPAEKAIGKSMNEVFGASEEQTRIENIYKKVLATHQPVMFETTLGLKDSPRAFEVNAYPSTRGVSVVAKDVTERKRAESLMQKRFELMEYSGKHSLYDLMQRTLDEISAWTHSAIGFFQLIEEDQLTPNMQVWSTNTLKQSDVLEAKEIHKPADQAGAWAEAVRLRRAVIHNDYMSLTRKNGLPDGHITINRELVIPIIRNEKIVAVIGIGNKAQEYTRDDLTITERFADYAWDIIERKQMESALAEERNQLAKRVEERTSDLSRANANLARALRVKDEFLANMSHELRTPLNAILGLSESLGEQIAGPLNDKQLKYINTISESGHHLLSLINDILDLAKIEAGQITLDINKVDVNSVCQASLRMIKQLAQKKNLDVSLEIDANVGLMWADERRLKQMMVNLLSNAVKFTPENGKVGLQVQGDQTENKVSITVWDTGIGIKDNDFQRLFQPFMQLDSGLARESTGTGLGLALVAQMARLHGGSVSVSSDPGKGSRFTIILPWEPAPTIDAVERLMATGKFRAIKPGRTQETILLVEDTQEVVMIIKDYLEMAGYKVFTAQDGLDGITQAKLTHPDLILMDIQMPRMDGLEATRRLRMEAEFKYTPIIALTALAMPNDRERCIEAGMDEYVSKPVNLRALVKIIHRCLSIGEERTRPQ